jgi:putative copper export protein
VVVWFAAGTAGAGAAALAVGMWLGGNLTQTQINGLAVGGTGGLTGWGLPTAKMVMDIAAVGVIGMLTACLLLPRHTTQPGEVEAMIRRCSHTGAWLALAWAAATTALLIFAWSDVVALPITDLPLNQLFTDTTTAFPQAPDYISTLTLALVIAAALTLTHTRRGAALLLPLTLYNLIPMALQGHASHATTLKYTLITHITAMALWAGGLTALLTHLRHHPTLLATALPRFSTLALTCYTTVTASGLLATWQLLRSPPALWQTRYGTLITLKTAALIALGTLGWWHRRHTIPTITNPHNQHPHNKHTHHAFTQLTAAEITIMTTAIAIAVTLSRTASPDTILQHSNRTTTTQQPTPSDLHTQPR